MSNSYSVNVLFGRNERIESMRFFTTLADVEKHLIALEKKGLRAVAYDENNEIIGRVIEDDSSLSGFRYWLDIPDIPKRK